MQGARRRLENRFRNVVLVPAIQILDVEVELAFLHKRLQELFDQFRLQIADSRNLETPPCRQGMAGPKDQ